jgi:amino acid transporter
MSGDLKDPSRSIPRGTLYGLGTTFFTYTVVILSLAFTVTRKSLYNDVNIMQDVRTEPPSWLLDPLKYLRNADEVRRIYPAFLSFLASLLQRFSRL